jgi:hypothetical protein
MKLVCAWCVNEVRPGGMGEKPPYADSSVTHGICPECLAKWRGQVGFWRARSLDLANLLVRPNLSHSPS